MFTYIRIRLPEEVSKLLKEVADMKQLGLLDESPDSTAQSKGKKEGARGSRKKKVKCSVESGLMGSLVGGKENGAPIQ